MKKLKYLKNDSIPRLKASESNKMSLRRVGRASFSRRMPTVKSTVVLTTMSSANHFAAKA